MANRPVTIVAAAPLLIAAGYRHGAPAAWSFATWQAGRAIGDHDRSTRRLRLDPQGAQTGFEPGITVWLSR
jgi:hypothetical protein